MTTIVLGAGLARRPMNGGGPWEKLQWVFGLRRLGFEVYLVDQISRESCFDAAGAGASFESSLNLAYFREVVEMFGLHGRAALIYGDGEAVEGATQQELFERAEAAELLVNFSGKIGWDPLVRRFRRKAYIDTDPGFTQFSGVPASGDSTLAGYDAYFTVGENVGHTGCSIPTAGIDWRPLRPPVALSEWPVSKNGDPGRFTTVATWRGRPFGSQEYGGRKYGLKADEFLKFVELPERTEQAYEIALNLDAPKPLLPDGPYPPLLEPGANDEVELLRQHHWQLVDPRVATPEPLAFQRYVQQSGAEFSAAKGIYVETGSGWFSERSVCYLASGKPVLVQDTGFGRTIPVGEGIVPFSTLEQAVKGARRIARDYPSHCEAARRMAEEHFDSDKLLGRMLDEAGVGRGMAERKRGRGL
jgi:hypothetical protein